MKTNCKNCKNWSKVSGTKTAKTEQGLCSFLNGRIHTIWQDDKKPERDKNNKSLVINTSSEICGKIGDLEISSTSKNLIHNHTYIWTDAGFHCAGHLPI